MLDNIRSIERQISESRGDSIHDLENTNYWELLEILNAKEKSQQNKSETQPRKGNAYDFFMK